MFYWLLPGDRGLKSSVKCRTSVALHGLPGLPPRYLSDATALRDYYSAADVVWHPSRGDTSSMVSLEAFGCGTPVIAAAVGGVPEIVSDGQAGLLIPADDAGALVAATRRILDTPGLLQKLQRGALTKAAEHSPERFVDEYLQVYERAIAPQATVSVRS